MVVAGREGMLVLAEQQGHAIDPVKSAGRGWNYTHACPKLLVIMTDVS